VSEERKKFAHQSFRGLRVLAGWQAARGVVWRVTTHTRRKCGDSFSYRLIFYIIAADEQNTHAQKAKSAASFFSTLLVVSAFDTSGLRQKIIASPTGDVI
jgi:hypothetical protein